MAVEVLKDGITVELSRGVAHNDITGVESPIRESVVAAAGDRFELEELDPGLRERLEDGDPWLEDKLAVISKKEAAQKDEEAEVHAAAHEAAAEINAADAAGEVPIVEGELDAQGLKEMTAKEVESYLDRVSDEEVDRVKALEKKGKGRTTILDYEPQRAASEEGDGSEGSEDAGGGSSEDEG